MLLDYLKDSTVEETDKLCPHCQDRVLKILAGPKNKYYYYFCDNSECYFLGMINVSQVKSLIENYNLLVPK